MMNGKRANGFSRSSGHDRPFPPPRDFSSLSIRDLLEAREHYHVHLSSIESVVGTAIGRYRIHQKDWYATHPPSVPRGDKKIDEARTFENSVVRHWSWPAVLVMVDRWMAPGEHGFRPIPKQLYLPDGRVIPTCVVFAPPNEDPAPLTTSLGYSSELVGGGYSCTRTAQGSTRAGTIGCLVEREGTYFALTNRHVAGPDGGAVDAIIRGERTRIGTSHSQSANRVTMTEIFPEWPGQHTFINIDAGLILIDDITRWTSQVFGIGEVAEPFDATTSSLTLDMIGCPLRAFGGTSGVLEGEIQALFVRYKSLGGFDYVSDILIGRRKPKEDQHRNGSERASVDAQPGDSGTVWFYDPPNNPPRDMPAPAVLQPEPPPERGMRARRLKPIAMQWGARRIKQADGKTTTHALATFLSTACRVLDVDIVHAYGTGHDEYWGKIGHFSIGFKACALVDGSKFAKLSTLMLANQRRIGFDDATLSDGKSFHIGRGDFVPLSDVPDYVWIANPKRRDSEAGQHFADVDIVDINGHRSMLDRCVADDRNISATAWRDYFDGFAKRDVGPDEGSLPFRVWQIWDEMVDALGKRDVLRFVVTAGVLAHYVGDASQPLHCSWLHHGRPPTTKIGRHEYPPRRSQAAYKTFHDSPAAQIHGLYEESMLELQPDVALAGVDAELKRRRPPRADVGSGFEAAKVIIDLMDAARKRLSPEDIIEADDPTLKPKERAERLWDNAKVHKATIASLADSTHALARLWQSAWIAGKGDLIAKVKLRQFEELELQKVYKTILPAHTLAELAQSGHYEPPKRSPSKPRRSAARGTITMPAPSPRLARRHS